MNAIAKDLSHIHDWTTSKLEEVYFSPDSSSSEIMEILKTENATTRILASGLSSGVRPFVILSLIHPSSTIAMLREFNLKGNWSHDVRVMELLQERISEIEDRLAG